MAVILAFHIDAIIHKKQEFTRLLLDKSRIQQYNFLRIGLIMYSSIHEMQHRAIVC